MHWAENTSIFKDKGYAFRVTFLNKCDELEKKLSLNITRDVSEKIFLNPQLMLLCKVEKKTEKLEEISKQQSGPLLNLYLILKMLKCHSEIK